MGEPAAEESETAARQAAERAAAGAGGDWGAALSTVNNEGAPSEAANAPPFHVARASALAKCKEVGSMPASPSVKPTVSP